MQEQEAIETETPGTKKFLIIIGIIVLIGLIVSLFFILSGKKDEDITEARIVETPENYPYKIYNDSAAEIVEQERAEFMEEGHGYTAAGDAAYYQLAIETQDSSLCQRITDAMIKQACIDKLK